MTDPNHSPRDTHSSGSHFQPSLSVVLIIVVLFIGATFFMVRAIAPSSTATTTTSLAGGTTTTTAGGSTARIVKSKVRVQVANATEKQGLAAHFTQLLMTQDWDTLPPGNASHVAATIVYYNPGFKAAASLIATTIKAPASSVKPLNGANPIAGSASDDVIVVLGPNSAIG